MGQNTPHKGLLFVGMTQIILFSGLSVILTCQIVFIFLSDGSVLQGQITQIPLSSELSTSIVLTPVMIGFNLVYNK